MSPIREYRKSSIDATSNMAIRKKRKVYVKMIETSYNQISYFRSTQPNGRIFISNNFLSLLYLTKLFYFLCDIAFCAKKMDYKIRFPIINNVLQCFFY